MTIVAKAADAACALRSLTAVVLDTETTSLDVRSARVIEIAGVALIDGVVEEKRAFSQLINPGEAISAESTAVHGITNEMIADAADFAAVYKRYAAFARDHLVLGHSLGFDLAVLKNECARAGLPWKPPRLLDVRDLLQVLNPQLPDHSLDTVADWLGIEIKERHRALPDAVLTGAVFLALLPRLRERGIRTLAEAEQACRVRVEKSETSVSGWHETAGAPSGSVTGALARVDSYPYRHRVAEVMGTPAITISSIASLQDALNLIVSRKISSVFVEPASAAAPFSILTERDILRAIAARPKTALTEPVASAASAPLETVSAEDFLYGAFGRMRRKRYRHLGVTDAEGKLVGALTQRDLLRQRADDAIALTDALDEAAGVAELAAIWRKLSDAAASLLEEDVDPRDIAAIISGEVCNLTERAARIAEREISVLTPAPEGLRFCVMVLGSGGRGESLLAMDQDNAIVFEPGDVGGAEDQWLKLLATRMNAILDEVGVPLCKGGVMAKNDVWRLPSAAWRKRVASWLSHSAPEDILNADIFFDAVPVHGAHRLADELRHDAIQAASGATGFLKLMTINTANADPPLGWFGRFRAEDDGRIDLKRGGIMPIFSAARVLALKHRVAARSTVARLEAMRGNTDIPQRHIDTLLEAHKIILGVILRQQLKDVQHGISPSSRVNPKDIPPVERDRLKWALEQVKLVRDLLGDPIG